MTTSIRDERPGDASAIAAINRAAFPTDGEARLVDALRGRTSPWVSLVAVAAAGAADAADAADTVVGHLLCTPVTVGGDDDAPEAARALALGPMAVLPEHQRRGVGSALVRAALERCRDHAPALFVLGHPSFYPRFGFVPARPLGFGCAWDVPDEVWMVAELRQGGLAGLGAGVVHYEPAFAAL